MASPLKFLLDLDAKLGKLPQADNILGRITRSLQRLNPEIRLSLRSWDVLASGAGKALGGLREGVNRAGKGIGQFGRDALAHFTALASFNGLSMLAHSAMGLARSLIQTVANGERADAVMRSLVGPEMAGRIDKWAEELSKVTEFDDDDIKRFASGLLKVGVAADQLPDHLRIAADLAALTDTDNPAQALAEIGQALETMQLKGGLDFKILRNAGISKEDFFGPIAERMGLSIDAVEKRAAEGKIKLDVLRNQMKSAITAKTGKGSGFVALERGGGLSASMARLSRVPEDLFKSFKGSDAAASMGKTFERLAVILGPEGPVGKAIVGGLGSAFASIAKWLEGLDFNKVIADVKDFGESALLVFKLVSTAAGWVWTAFKAVGTFIGEALAQLFIEFENLTNVGTKLGDFFGGVYVTISDWASKLFEGAKRIGTRLWEGIKDGIASGAAVVGGAMGKLLGSLMGTTEEELEIHSPSRVFERYGALTGAGFAKGLAGASPAVAATSGDTYSIPAPSSRVTVGRRLGNEGGGRGKSSTINVPITVNYTGSGGKETAQEVAEALAQILPGQLVYALDRVMVELGTG